MLDEHERILFGIHGIPRCSLEDDPVALEARLKDLEIELESIQKDREEYDHARANNPTFVNSRRFRLVFLRSESYNAKAAAEMIISHFRVKKQLFGDGEILSREVRQSDLHPMDLVLLHSGFIQIFPCRDAAGRTIVAVSPEFRHHGSKEMLKFPLRRAFWYFAMKMINDEETQCRGLVMVLYNYCGFRVQMDLTGFPHQLRTAIPQPVEAIHVCAEDPSLQVCIISVQLFIDRISRFRVRSHFGTPEQNNFELQTFGIPTQDSPMKLDKTWSTEWHLQWLKAHRDMEELSLAKDLLLATTNHFGLHAQQKEEEIILVPRRFDVLFGKGKREREHTGNLRALHICDMYKEKYESSNKSGKTDLGEKIVLMIQQSGGRFLKPKRGGWVEIDDLAAREKIAHFFRFMRSKNKTQDEDSHRSDSSSADNAHPVESRKRGDELANVPPSNEMACPTTPQQLTL